MLNRTNNPTLRTKRLAARLGNAVLEESGRGFRVPFEGTEKLQPTLGLLPKLLGAVVNVHPRRACWAWESWSWR